MTAWSRLRSVGAWLTGTGVAPSEFEAIDDRLSKTVNAAEGGTYAPTSPLVIDNLSSPSITTEIGVAVAAEATARGTAISTLQAKTGAAVLGVWQQQPLRDATTTVGSFASRIFTVAANQSATMEWTLLPPPASEAWGSYWVIDDVTIRCANTDVNAANLEVSVWRSGGTADGASDPGFLALTSVYSGERTFDSGDLGKFKILSVESQFTDTDGAFPIGVDTDPNRGSPWFVRLTIDTAATSSAVTIYGFTVKWRLVPP